MRTIRWETELPFLNTPVFVSTRNKYDNAYNEGEIVNSTVMYITDDESDSGDNGANDITSVSGVVVSKLPAASSSYRGWTLILAGDDDDVAYTSKKPEITCGIQLQLYQAVWRVRVNCLEETTIKLETANWVP